jgi:hypothetical protein
MADASRPVPVAVAVAVPFIVGGYVIPKIGKCRSTGADCTIQVPAVSFV